MGSNMNMVRLKRRRSSQLVVGKGSKVVKSKEKEVDFDLDLELFRSMTDDLLTEILVRLPSESVCRFRLVCKHWRSLLSSDYLESRFIKHNDNRECPFTLVFQYSVYGPSGGPKFLYPIGAISNHPVLSKSVRNRAINLIQNIKRDFDNSFLKSEPISPVASCHDLLLCCHFGTYYVVNLLTRCWILVPPPPIRNQDRELTPLSIFLNSKAGIFCDQKDVNNGDGFKVILLPAVREDLMFDTPPNSIVIPPEIYASQFSVRIFSSKSRQWVDIDVDWYPLSLNAHLFFAPILFHEGMLHWLNGRSLASLDAHNMNLTHSIDLPNELSLQFPCGFGVCQGKFRVARLIYKEPDGRVLLVWDLEDYHKGGWHLAHRVFLHQPSLKKYNYVFRLMAFHPYNSDIIFVEISNGVFQFNMRTGILESYYHLKLEKGDHTLQPSYPLLLHRGFPTVLPP